MDLSKNELELISAGLVALIREKGRDISQSLSHDNALLHAKMLKDTLALQAKIRKELNLGYLQGNMHHLA